jgi:hypothetical protein
LGDALGTSGVVSEGDEGDEGEDETGVDDPVDAAVGVPLALVERGRTVMMAE